MSMIARYTLRYVTASGQRMMLVNLGEVACDDIVLAQSVLGSHGFRREMQTHHFSPFESQLALANDIAQELRDEQLAARKEP